MAFVVSFEDRKRRVRGGEVNIAEKQSHSRRNVKGDRNGS